MTFYVNIIQSIGDAGKPWEAVWDEKFFGSYRRCEAVRLRRCFFGYLRLAGSPLWKEKHLRTIKVELQYPSKGK